MIEKRSCLALICSSQAATNWVGSMNSAEADKNAHENEQILKTLLSSMPGMAYRSRYDPDNTMEFVSEGCFELTGYMPEDLVKNKRISYGMLIHPLDREAVKNQVQAALRENIAFDIYYRINTSSGIEKWVRDRGRGVYLSNGEVDVVEGFISDVTDRKESEKRIQRQVQRFEALRKIDIAITASLDQRVTFDILLDQVTTQLSVDAAGLLIYNPSTRLLEFAAGRGFRTAIFHHTRLRLGEGYAGVAALDRKTIHIPNLNTSLGQLGRAAHIRDEGFFTYYCVPLVAKGLVKGILEIFHRSPLQPDAEWLDFLEALAGQAAIAIDNASLFNELQRSNMELSLAYDATLEGWSKALELRDQETEGHTQRVTELTLRLAEAMQVTSVDPLHIRRGALLHDIGKMGIPDRILLKPGPLSEEEWHIMRQHPVYAYKLLSPIANLRLALDIPYCHHEKWDGSGYPRGLRGEEIPLVARIFSIVDVWDALRSDRYYRPAWPEEKAFNYLKEQSGKHFDPEVVKVFSRIIDEARRPLEGSESGLVQ
jgi:PAS domain S-box-containing protein/putative nucleotidyltransferase with HDIG domain